MKPWAIYVRVSDEDQAELGASIPAQADSCRSYARARGWTVAHELVDDGYTGRNGRRPAYQRLLEMIRGRAIAGVIAWKLKRLSRSLRDTIDLIELIRDTSVELVTVVEHWDTTSPQGRAMINVGAIFNQLESEDNGVQTAAAMKYLKRHGYFVGGAVPAGCRVDVVDDGKRRKLVRGEHADEVAKVWPAIIDGASLLDVARQLDLAGVPAPRNRRTTKAAWAPDQVRRLILSPQVVGILVDPATQVLARSILAGRATPFRRGRAREAGAQAAEPSILAGLMRCPSCSAAMCQVRATGHGGSYRYFRCVQRIKGLCPQKDLRCEPIESKAIECLADAMQPDGEYHQKARARYEETRGSLEAMRTRRASLASERDQLSARIRDLTLRMQIGSPGWDEAMKHAGEELQRVDKELVQLNAVISASEVDRGSLDLVLAAVTEGAQRVGTQPAAEQARIMTLLVGAVRIESDGGQDFVVLELYEPQRPGDAGSYKGRKWLPGSHGKRTIPVRRPVVLRAPQKRVQLR